MSRSVMIDATELAGTVFSGLSAQVIEDVESAGEGICVRARTTGGPVACPWCGAETGRVHGYHERTAADVPVGGRRVLVRVRSAGCATRSQAARGRPSASRSRVCWSVTSGGLRG